MPAYAYKAHINRGREKIGTEHTRDLDTQRLTVSLLASIVGENVFSITDDEHGDGCTISWTEYRDETDDEYNARIARLEAYNAEVDRRKKGA